jgi:hypothetical protein
MTRGFTLFIALLVSSLALAIGLVMLDITLRTLTLSQTSVQSQYSVTMADSGAECALYWDNKCTGAGCTGPSAFATSSASLGKPANSSVLCNGNDITGTGYSVVTSASAATTTFTVASTTVQGPCAVVTVAKYGIPARTTIVSHGYNSCATSVIQLERVFQITY